MIEAIPIDSNGYYIGSCQKFTNQQWDSMKEAFGKNLRWKLIEDIEEEPEISIEESKKIFGEEKEYEVTADGNNGDILIKSYNRKKAELEEYTKRELIEKYALSEELMKNKKDEIIDEINKLF